MNEDKERKKTFEQSGLLFNSFMITYVGRSLTCKKLDLTGKHSQCSGVDISEIVILVH